jgi:DNA-binding NarL/FixJ family response regulator
MITAQNTWTATSGLLSSSCIIKGWKSLGAKVVIVASNSRCVQDWMYRYLEPYVSKGYAFYLIDNEADFTVLAERTSTVMAFIEDIFFGDKTIGRLEYIHKKHQKIHPVVFSASGLSAGTAARYVRWGKCSYLSLRDSEWEIKEALEAVFRKEQSVPSYLQNRIDEYSRLKDIEPYLTHREIEIVRYTAEEKTAKEIAAILMVSEKTVKNHLVNIYEKFGIHKMVGVLKLAVRKGILPMNEIMTYTV